MLRPGGYVAFSTWQLGERHQISGVVGATMERMTPGVAQFLPAQDMSTAEPVLALLQAGGFRDSAYRQVFLHSF